MRRRYDPVVYKFPPPGTKLELPLIRGTQHLTAVVTTREIGLESLYRIQQLISTIFALIALGITAWLVIVRPSTMTWSLFAVLVGLNISGPTCEYLSPFGYWWVVGGEMFCSALQSLWIFVIVFASRVPNNRVARWMRGAQRFAFILFLMQVAVSLYTVASWAFFGVLAPNLTAVSFTIGVLAVATALAALIHNYTIADGRDRHRMTWVLFGGGVWCAAALALWWLGTRPFYDSYVVAEMFYVVQSIAVVLIVYGIMRSRVVDVTFVLSRAVVVSALTGCIILVFALLDWIFNKKLEATQLGAVTQFVAAIALGIWLDHLHKRADVFVDRLLFRARYVAQQRLEKAAHAVLHSERVDVIQEFLVDEPFVVLGLGSAAVFQANDRGEWARVRACGWEPECVSVLSRQDTLVMHVEAEQTALRVSEIRWPLSSLPSGTARPVLAVPVLARRRVIAIVLYGEHTNGADLDGDEVRAIEGVVNAAGAAFDHVEAEQLRHEMESLRRELALKTSTSTA